MVTGFTGGRYFLQKTRKKAHGFSRVDELQKYLNLFQTYISFVY